MSKTQKEFIDEIVIYIRALSDDEKGDFAIDSIFEIALWASYNHVEMFGFLECVKIDLINAIANVDDDDGDEWKKLINKN